jgi:hypothetical protein
MQPIATAVFAITMLLALTALIMEKLHRNSNTARVNRGLRGYVTAKSTVRLPEPEETPEENLIAA